MKIIVSATLGGFSAGTWYAVETARRLQDRGHRIIYIGRPGGESTRRAQAAGLPTTDVIDLEKKSPRRAYDNVSRLLKLVGEFGPDAILAHAAGDHSFWGLTKLIVKQPLPLIRVRALDPKPPKRHPLARWLHYRGTDAVVTANSRHYDYYQRRLHIPPGRMRIIEAGIDPQRFADLGEDRFRANDVTLPNNSQLIVLLARFAPIKGHRVLISSAQRIKTAHPDVHFVFIGRAAAYTKEDLQRWTVEFNLRDDVTIIDRDLPDVPALLARCTLGIVSSIGSETVSRALHEYCASGLPVVATDVGGIRDLMSRGDFGRLIHPDNSADMAHAVCELLNDTKSAKLMGQAARNYVLRHCTWDRRVDQWEQILYETVARVRGTDIPRLKDGEPPGCAGQTGPEPLGFPDSRRPSDR